MVLLLLFVQKSIRGFHNVGLIINLKEEMFKKIRKHSSTSFIVFFQGCSVISGVIRETILAAFFGASFLLDSFLVCFMPIDILFSYSRDLYGVVLPRIPKGDAANQYLIYLTKFFSRIAFILTIIYFTMPLIWCLTNKNHGQIELYFGLNLIMSPLVWAVLIHGVLTSFFIYYKKYFWASTGMLGFNIGLIMFVPLLYKFVGIYSAAIGVLIGMGLFVFMEYYFSGLRGSTGSSVEIQKSEFKSILRPASFLFIEIILMRGNVVIERIAGLLLGIGAASILNFSLRIVSLPINIILPAMLYPFFKSVVASIEVGDYKKTESLLWLNLLAGTILVGIIGLLIFLFRTPIVRIVLERGKFCAQDSAAVSAVLKYHVLSLLPWTYFGILNRFLWAFKKNIQTMVVSFVFVISELAGVLFLSRFFGINGVAMGAAFAFTCSAMVSGFFVIRILRKNVSSRICCVH